jgi:hypothetical protein
MNTLSPFDDSGEPIFPRDGFRKTPVRVEQQQITRREWFITNAPEVPKWFRSRAETPPPPNPPEPQPEEELTDDQQQELKAWTAGSAMDFAGLSAPVRDFMVRWQRAQDARKTYHEWHMKGREAKWWAWANYFADRMMEVGSGK